MSLQVTDRVAIVNKNNEVLGEGEIVNINDFREPSMKYAVDVDGYDEDFLFLGENQLVKLNVKPFKVGERVRVIKIKDESEVSEDLIQMYVGSIGTIVSDNEHIFDYEIKFDNPFLDDELNFFDHEELEAVVTISKKEYQSLLKNKRL